MKLFGTDGVRGLANTAPMTPDIMMRLAMAAGSVFKQGEHRHTVVIGKDTRLSGYMIEPALTAGFIAMGMNVVLVGPLPTPAISMLVSSMRADLGVMISASHNPYYDNGIKFFGPDGYKLSCDVEKKIENLVSGKITNLAKPEELGKAFRLESASGRYIEFVKNTLASSIRLDGLKIVIDCANGAAYHVAPKVFWELGAEVIIMGDKPDGFNINADVGAVSSEAMCQAVLTHGADIGIALDGDADRLVLSDEKGNIVDGDQIMALIATAWQKNGQLRGGQVVGTVMSNLGFENYLEKQGLELVRTNVGDRHVGDYMRKNGCNVGGEQSGHIILSDFARTGDGLVAALQVLAVLVDSKKPASQVCRVFEQTPQKLKSVRFQNGDPMTSLAVAKAIKEMEADLGKTGRVLVRKSGTEPLVRIMVESESTAKLDKVITYILDAMDQENFLEKSA